MADNETNIGNPSVDVDIIPKVVSLEQLMAQLVRSFAELKPVIYARVAIDRAVTGGVGEQVQRAVDEVANKLRLSFQAIGRADELQTGFRAIESHLQQITADAEKAGQALTMSLKGPSGEGTYTLKGRQGVSEFINRMPQYSAALGPSGSPITAGIGANINPSDANLESVKAIRESTGVITARTKAEQEAEKASKRQQEAGDKLAKWMDLAAGGRTQRALGSFLQGPLTAALGPEMGAMGAGLGAIIGGGALFHVGWAITNELSKLPEHIMEQIDIAREFNRMRAAATTGPAPLADMPATSPEAIARVQTDQTLQPRVQAAHDFWTRMRGDPKRYDSIMASLLMNVPAGDMKDAKKRDHWIETIDRLANQSLLAETMFPGETGKAENEAFTRFRMLVEHGGQGREALLGQKAFMDMAIQRLQAEYPHLQKAPRETLESVVRARVSGPSGNVAGGRFPGQWTAEDIDQLISSGMGPTPQMESVIKQMMGEENWKAWRHEHPLLWTDYSQRSPEERAFADTARTFLKPSHDTAAPTHLIPDWLVTEETKASRQLELYAASHRDPKSGEVKIAPHDIDDLIDLIQTAQPYPMTIGDMAGQTIGLAGHEPPSRDDLRKLLLTPPAEAGKLSDMFGTGGKSPDLPAWGPGTYSFSSMSGFANKMQAEAGIHLDWNEKNHDELIQIHAVLAARLNPPDPGGHKPIETPAAN